MGAHHAHAATGGKNDVARVAEDRRRVASHITGLGSPPRVVGGLATAGLSLRNIDLYAEVSKQPHSVRAGIRIELVGETRCKEGDLHASEPGPGTQGVRRKRCDVRRGGSIHDFKDSRVPSVVDKSVALIA
jgi:hypothetical protein